MVAFCEIVYCNPSRERISDFGNRFSGQLGHATILAPVMRAVDEFVSAVFLWRGPSEMLRVHAPVLAITATVSGLMFVWAGAIDDLANNPRC